MDKHLRYLRTRAYREGQKAAEGQTSPYWLGSTLDRAWTEGHRDVHFYRIKKFGLTRAEKITLAVSFTLVFTIVIAVTCILLKEFI